MFWYKKGRTKLIILYTTLNVPAMSAKLNFLIRCTLEPKKTNPIVSLNILVQKVCCVKIYFPTFVFNKYPHLDEESAHMSKVMVKVIRFPKGTKITVNKTILTSQDSTIENNRKEKSLVAKYNFCNILSCFDLNFFDTVYLNQMNFRQLLNFCENLRKGISIPILSHLQSNNPVFYNIHIMLDFGELGMICSNVRKLKSKIHQLTLLIVWS